MRHIVYAAALAALCHAAPAAAQPRASSPASAFSFDRCYSQCLNLGGSPSSCQPGCADRAATLLRIPPGTRPTGNNDPRSPRFHDPEPRQPSW
jgi:hypothetical protein